MIELFRRLVTAGMIVAGSIFVSAGLELFLLPNQIATGGITGVSILFSHMTEMELSLFLFLFNVPFVLRRRTRLRAISVIPLMLVGVITYFLHPIPAVVEDPLLAAIGGGMFLGFGLGILLRQGGRVDETPTAVRVIPLLGRTDLGIAILLGNLAVLLLAGAVFGLTQAVYSILAHALAYCMLEAGFTGMSPVKRMRIRSGKLPKLQEAAAGKLRLHWDDAGDGQSALCSIHRADLKKARQLFQSIDQEVVISNHFEEVYYGQAD